MTSHNISKDGRTTLMEIHDYGADVSNFRRKIENANRVLVNYEM